MNNLEMGLGSCANNLFTEPRYTRVHCYHGLQEDIPGSLLPAKIYQVHCYHGLQEDIPGSMLPWSTRRKPPTE